ncbi:putative PHD and RING finger domain protein [Aspergillus clavatus NRRL 1]|uniref:PHD and RING finger domain protein, putative n=1 Tax=Aspergillus clavatus (strain ATCC 1007 / CBS 513.65 / DSM 816 / NCTC 3887 / NRRL 1 / QM 1276 / 107) TaxID=344612 RepID=A1C820_ASPCL|nr:PHD and RING finger domain protein, putative [Aspergillus clavatus NRRL 1]EAW14541.1 PHD and RING finger domain protein, putative [Aspergillus clavatus NRRL 1]
MADTCIVCLGDLGESASDPLAIAAEAVPRPDLQLEGKSNDASTVKVDGVDDSEDACQIAQLLPCGHILHNNCLKPWVERANSCPICRRSFNIVELSDRLGGPVTSTYAVQDRIQVAEVDPSMIVDYVEDDLADVQPCPICGDADNEELLLLCDGCDAPSHTYCLGFDDVPSGAWYCSRCETRRSRALSPDAARPTRTQERQGRRTRAQQRSFQSRNQMNSLHWARVWQSVWDHLNLDLDFPFDDERVTERALQQQRREAANQREFRAWQRRFEVAERQGGSNRFRDTAALLDIEAPRPSRPRVPREPTPEPESLEEMRAWNAFERAREIENNPNAARKRKEPTLSPSPEPTEPQRKLKRPRTRRPQELAALALQNGESSRAASAQTSARINAESSSEPSFLQSLLKEVEDASNPSGNNSSAPSAPVSVAPTDHSTIGPSSPSISPAPSNLSSPRLSSTTPPPYSRSRPISPIQLSSPPDLSSPPFSATVSPSGPNTDTRDTSPSHGGSSRPGSRIPRAALRLLAARSPGTSPTRPGLSLDVKSDIQRLVGAALKPYYRSRIVSKEQYTEINRTVSRMLYDRVGDAEFLDTVAKNDLEKIASEEVKKAIDLLPPEVEDD